jgi:hypothetical protein
VGGHLRWTLTQGGNALLATAIVDSFYNPPVITSVVGSHDLNTNGGSIITFYGRYFGAVNTTGRTVIVGPADGPADDSALTSQYSCTVLPSSNDSVLQVRYGLESAVKLAG